MKDNILFRTASELAGSIKSKEISATELLEAHLSQIATHNPKLNAIITLDEEVARQRAKAADEALAQGKVWGPLHGVPITIKDCYETSNLRTTCSFQPLENYIPDQDATVVCRLRQAGAIIMGKTHTPPLNQDFQTRSPMFGVTNNPWNLDYTPGGSSGGAAAALAAGLTALDIGCDDGGSIRIPASYCGVYGFKPTEHLVSGAGQISLAFPGKLRSFRNLISYGPLARSVEDLKLCLQIIAGADNRDFNVPKVTLKEAAERSLKELRIAWTDGFGNIPVAKEIQEAIQSFAHKLSQEGAHVEKLNPAKFDPEKCLENYGELFGNQTALQSSEEERKGIYESTKQLAQLLPYFRRRFLPRTLTSHMAALDERDQLIADFEDFMSGWDVWLCPVTSTPPFPHIAPIQYVGPNAFYAESISMDGSTIPYLLAMACYAMVFNGTGSPAVTIPIAKSKEGLPIGIQVVGRRWRDMELLDVAQQLSKVIGTVEYPIY